ncbi:P-loop containing nucleoside triphosphate hydrolase protein [Mycena galopus ATCC 62051]|nr:P-loop containing nucleoside triphosphate hydrolase protein [Mycena galopus ATCC 62051]
MYSDPSNAGIIGGDPQLQWFTSFLGISSVFAAVGMLSQSYLGSSVKLLILGSIVEVGRRLFQWLAVRFRFQYSMTAQFSQGDPAYECIMLFLTQENVWNGSREFVVTAKNSRRKWAVKTWLDPTTQGNAEYVPTYQAPQLFRWRGHWVEIKRGKDNENLSPHGFYHVVASISLTIYTLDMKLLSELVEDARTRYVEINRPNVIIHLADSPHHGPMAWTSAKHKVGRPLSSVILQDGVVDALVRDAKEFLATEDWHVEAGIPHRRGYLLYGPPGTGKTSTIYALAGALNLEIYSLSLASSFVDDSFLQRAASSIPQNALFLIEDIDCAFASREDEEEEEEMLLFAGPAAHGELLKNGKHGSRGAGARGARETVRSQVTLSGLLNVIDGVGSDDGKLFIATTNYIDRLDPALLRPGRIDLKVPYGLATAHQARALFLRFFPESRFPEFAVSPASDLEKLSSSDTSILSDEKLADSSDSESTKRTIPELADAFAAAIPADEFSTAELQGYLQSHKKTPVAAMEGAGAWVEEIQEERKAREEREAERRRRIKARRDELQFGARGGTMVSAENVRRQVNDQDETSTADGKSSGEDSPKEGSGSEFSSYADGALPAQEEERAK